MNAGLLALVAVIGWQVYARRDDWPALLLACVAAYAGYLLRSQQLCLVLFVALPLLPWHAMRRKRPMQIAFLVLSLLIGIAAFMDYRAYQSPEWQTFNEFERIVRPYVDFGGDAYLSERSEILAHYGYSPNDIRLFGDWFFVDPMISNVKALKGMLEEVGPFYLQGDSLSHGWQGITALLDRRLWIPVLAALLLALLKPSRQVALTWILFLFAILVLGLMGRPGVLRVYEPLLSVLVVAPLLFGTVNVRRSRIIAGVLVLACIGQVIKITREYRWLENWSEKIQKGMMQFPSDKVIVWGGFFPYEAVYPVLQKTSDIQKYHLYALDFQTLAPFSLAVTENNENRGMIDELKNQNGARVVAGDASLNLLRQYCIEHLRAPLRELDSHRYSEITQGYGEVVVRTLTCSSEPSEKSEDGEIHDSPREQGGERL